VVRTEEQVWTILVEANPVPDVDRDEATDLATPMRRSSEMTQLDTRKTDEKPSTRPPMVWLAAAIAIVVVGALIILTRSGGDEIDPADLPTTEGAGVRAVNTWIDAFNSGDFVALSEVAVLAESEDPNGFWSWSYGGDIRYMEEVFMNANARITVLEPCQLVSLDPKVVECLTDGGDDFWGAAGLGGEATMSFTLNEENLVVGWSDDQPCCEAETALHRAFNTWLAENHPDVRADISPAASDAAPGHSWDPAKMSIAIEYMDEFLAQSEEYPLDN
jgi:hypothetical protein